MDLEHNCVHRGGGDQVCWGGERTREREKSGGDQAQSLKFPWEAGVLSRLSPTCPGMAEPRSKASPEWWR